MLGLTMEEAVSGQVFEVWQDCWTSVGVLSAIATQWRVGGDGPIGLDYAAIPVALRLMGIPRREWQQVFDDVRVMEDAALKYFAFMRKRNGRSKGAT
jgi:hypothetical protein